MDSYLSGCHFLFLFIHCTESLANLSDSISWVHIPRVPGLVLCRPWVSAVQLVNEKQLFFSCQRISQFNLQFHQREQKSGESHQYAAPWKRNTSRSNRKAKVSRELHINANMLIWILSGYFLLRIHKGACALHQWINWDYARGLFFTLLEQDWEVEI